LRRYLPDFLDLDIVRDALLDELELRLVELQLCRANVGIARRGRRPFVFVVEDRRRQPVHPHLMQHTTSWQSTCNMHEDVSPFGTIFFQAAWICTFPRALAHATMHRCTLARNAQTSLAL
jgi:hypothetical protein